MLRVGRFSFSYSENYKYVIQCSILDLDYYTFWSCHSGASSILALESPGSSFSNLLLSSSKSAVESPFFPQLGEDNFSDLDLELRVDQEDLAQEKQHAHCLGKRPLCLVQPAGTGTTTEDADENQKDTTTSSCTIVDFHRNTTTAPDVDDETTQNSNRSNEINAIFMMNSRNGNRYSEDLTPILSLQVIPFEDEDRDFRNSALTSRVAHNFLQRELHHRRTAHEETLERLCSFSTAYPCFSFSTLFLFLYFLVAGFYFYIDFYIEDRVRDSIINN